MALKIKAPDLPDFDMAEYFKTDEDVANARTLVLVKNDPTELTQVAQASGLTREALNKALRPTAHPRFDTIALVCTALGLKLVGQPMQA